MSTKLLVPVSLSDGTIIKIETSPRSTEQDISAIDSMPFSEMTKAIKGIGESFIEVFNSVKPDKASVKLGLEIGLESGGLTAIIVKGTGKANFEITLEWEKKS